MGCLLSMGMVVTTAVVRARNLRIEAQKHKEVECHIAKKCLDTRFHYDGALSATDEGANQ